MDRVILARLSWALTVTMRRHSRTVSELLWDFGTVLYDCDFSSESRFYRAALPALMVVHVLPHAASVRHSEGFRRYAV